jgi:signal transduction histidine kinase
MGTASSEPSPAGPFGRWLGRARRLDGDVWDVVLAAAFGLIAVVVLLTHLDESDVVNPKVRDDDVWLWLATFAVIAALRWRRRYPLGSYIAGSAVFLAMDVATYRDSLPFGINALAIYAVGAYAVGWRRWGGPAVVATMVAVVIITRPSGSPADGIANAMLLLGSAWVLGWLVGGRRRQLRAQVEEARLRAQLATEEAELASVAERLRIAQELHDVVAHSMSVIAVQAGVGEHLQRSQPEEAAKALDAISDTSRSTLAELRRLLAGMRETGGDAPAPTLADIDGLAAPLRAAGLSVRLVVEGSSSDVNAAGTGVPPGVELAAYRIVQEALTNVLKHAQAHTVDVAVRAGPTAVEVEVADDGTGGPHPTLGAAIGGGNGLVGMRERVAVYGGGFSAGPRPGGGFVVRARLPFDEAATSAGSGEPSVPDAAGEAPRPRRRPRLTPFAGDCVLAGFVTLLAVATLIGTPDVDPARGLVFRHTDALTWVLTLGACIGLAGRRRWPLTSLIVTFVLLLALTIPDYQTGVVPIVPVVSLYSVAAYADDRRMAVAIAVSLVGLAIAFGSDPPDLTAAGTVVEVLFFAGAVLVGWLVRRSRDQLHRDVDEAAAAAEAGRRHAELARANERLHIARELHDVVAHSLSVIAVQAGTGRHLLASDPDAAGRALGTISQVSRSTLTELRRILGVLRTADGSRSFAPAPGLADVEGLVSQAGEAGLCVAVTVEGDRDGLPAGVDLSAYRVVQEALTNVLQHAGPATAAVAVRYAPDAVEVEITDDGRGAGARPPGLGASGHGLTVMRERVAIFGGDVQAGPRPGGGYRVLARIPHGGNP